jgi:hypothetical protein
MKKQSSISVYTYEGSTDHRCTQKERGGFPTVLLLVTAEQAIGEQIVDTLTSKMPSLVIWTKRMRDAIEIVESILPDMLLLDEICVSLCEGAWYRRLQASKGMEQVPIVAFHPSLPHEWTQEAGSFPLTLKESLTRKPLQAILDTLREQRFLYDLGRG